MNKTENLGCTNPHGHYPFPANRGVCPECQAIQARLHEAVSWRRGLPYRWWRDIPWGLVVTCVMTAIICFFATIILGAWVFDWKPFW